MPNKYHIKHRRDTAANWALRNPTPADGEVCIETDTKKKKIGDGVTAYNSLPYDQPSNATSSAAGLMSAADKQKLDSINMSQYAKLQSPVFTGTPNAPTASGFNPSKQIANADFALNGLAKIALPSLCVRVVFSLPSTTTQNVINDTGLASCVFMAVNGKAVSIEKSQKLLSGTNTVDFLFLSDSKMLIAVPGTAFKSIANIETVILPERLRVLEQDCFAATNVKYLYCLAPTPPTLNGGVFAGTPIEDGTGTVYCHKAFATIYQTEWATIPNITTL